MPPPSDWDGCPEPSTPPVEPLSPLLVGDAPLSSHGGQSQVGTGVEDELLESDDEDGLLESDEDEFEEEEGELLRLAEEPEADDENEPESDEETLADSEVDVEVEALVDEVDPLEEDELMVAISIRC